MLITLSDFEGLVCALTRFDRGQLVRHQQLGYRGVVVAWDSRCLAGDTWYFTHTTQPPRDQPWYHLLVDASGGLSTYVAQSELCVDIAGIPIDHPRISVYFSEFKGGRYLLRPEVCLGVG